jgi:NAD(P)-dependent dehydrogenase (short-subunit alcohol dehydrogenase family)
LKSLALTQLVYSLELDVLVNNSGSNWGAPYDEYPSEAFTRVLTLNLHRVFDLTKLVTPLLEKAATPNNPARIINIGSIDGLRVPSLETFAYSSSKAGLHHLSRVLANHLGKRNITYVYLLLLCLCFLKTNLICFIVRIPWPVARSRAK